MGKIKWYKRDPNAALTGMLNLNLEERGAYNTILDLIYAHDDSLVDDERHLCGWLKCDVRVWRRMKQRLLDLGKIVVEDGIIHNRRATDEALRTLSLLEVREKSGRAGGQQSGISRGKSMNGKGLTEPHAQATGEQNQTHTYIEAPRSGFGSKKDAGQYRAPPAGSVQADMKARAKCIAETGRAMASVSDHEAWQMVQAGLLTTEQAIAAGYRI